MIQNYTYRIYTIFYNRLVILLRIAFFSVIPIFVYVNQGEFDLVKKALFVYFLMLVQEAYLYTKIYKSKPKHNVYDEDIKDNEELMDLKVKYVYSKYKNSYEVVKNTPHKIHEIVFIIKKIGGKFELPKSEIYKEELLKKSKELVQKVGGNYITGLDIFVAYLLLSEEKSKLLKNKNLNPEDVTNILYWARNKYRIEEKKSLQPHFTGSGVFDSFVYGWNVEVKKYTNDLTRLVLSKKNPPKAVGRKDEYEQLLTALLKSDSNNVLLVGESGTGRESLVEFFAYYSHLGQVPKKLSHKRIHELYVDQLLSGIENEGELEERLNSFLSDLEHTGNAVLLIQNIENILGGGGFDLDATATLKRYLESNKITIIGTTTSQMYESVFERHENIKQYFEIIELNEPDIDTALFMLFEKASEIEEKYNIELTYDAIQQAAELSSSLIHESSLPGKAINLLEGVSSSVRLKKKDQSFFEMIGFEHTKNIVTKDDVVGYLERKTKVILSDPTKEEKKLLLNLENKIHEKIVYQDDAVNAIAEAFRRLRTGFVNKNRPISSFLFLGPTGVGKTATAKAISEIYFGDVKAMIRLDMSEYQEQNQIDRILGAKPGFEYIPNTLVEEIKNRPFSLILLDEFEKAHPQILDLFLQILDEGRITSNEGDTISLTQSIIIATSNAGSELIRERISKSIDHAQLKKELIEHVMQEGIFKPELLNRFDEVIVFKPLPQEALKEVVKLMLIDSLKQLDDDGISVTFDQNVVQKIVSEGYSMEFGARNIRRYIQDSVENFLSKKILEGSVEKGGKYSLSIDSSGEFIIQ